MGNKELKFGDTLKFTKKEKEELGDLYRQYQAGEMGMELMAKLASTARRELHELIGELKPELEGFEYIYNVKSHVVRVTGQKREG